MIIGFHFIFSAYGFWLPNDPRGSWSETVRSHELACFGPATKVNTTRSVVAQSHDHSARLAAKRALKYPPVRFTGEQAVCIACGFEAACNEAAYRPLALAILPDHVHVLLAYHAREVDTIASHLKSKATRALSDAGRHPLAAYSSASGRVPSPWARGYWCPFVRNEEQMHVVVNYVNDNPVRAGLPRQQWSMVKPYRA